MALSDVARAAETPNLAIRSEKDIVWLCPADTTVLDLGTFNQKSANSGQAIAYLACVLSPPRSNTNASFVLPVRVWMERVYLWR